MRRLLLLLTLIAAVQLAAQESQTATRERGVKPEQLYDFSQFDTINLFNGNLNLAIPIASPYPVAEGLSYQFVLHYSGNVWTTREHCTPTERENDNCGIWYRPQRDNAGLGWRLSFGELRAPLTGSAMQHGTANTKWQYTGPDGGEHLFYATLHEPRCESGPAPDCDEVRDGVRYTRDGTYLRMKPAPDGAQVIEFGDGRRQRFTYNSVKAEWELEYIYAQLSPLDTNGRPTASFVKFEYLDGNNDGVRDWKITDSQNRTHWVYFRTGPLLDVVAEVVVAAFRRADDPSDAAATATYDLSYDNYSVDANGKYVDGTVTALLKPCEEQHNTTPASVRLLTRVGLPDSTAFTFAYHQPTQACSGALTERSDAGALKSATLPTLGVLEWAYQRYEFSNLGGDQYANGVKTKVVRSATGTILQKTAYTPGSSGIGTGYVEVAQCRAWTDTSCTPETRAKHHFTTALGSNFGLPFTPAIVDAKGRSLSTETFACNPACGATPVKQTYVRYEFDQMSQYANDERTEICTVDFPCARDRNRRVASQRVLYPSDNGAYVDTDSSAFDGLGNYRTTIRSGFADGGATRTTTVNYNASLGTYGIGTSGYRVPGYTTLGPDEPWLLGLYTTSDAREANADRRRTEVCFDQNGLMIRKRVYGSVGTETANPERRGTDLLSVYTRRSDGFVSREDSYGGDHGDAVALTSLCGLTPPAVPVYRMDYTYAHGSLESSTYVRADGTPAPFFSLFNVIDRNTGFVKESRDVSDLSTQFSYDRRGRLETITSAGLAQTTYVYQPGSGTLPPRMTRMTGSGSTRTSSLYEFDELGRVYREQTLMPDGTWSARQKTWDSLGRLATSSEPETFTASFAPVSKTTYSQYDAFGRPGLITAPDQTKTRIAYAGVRTVNRYISEAGNTSESWRGEEIYDREGRLVEVRQQPDAAGVVSAKYGYNTAGQLVSVQMTAPGGTTQPRSFIFDGRGLLMSESHPESGSTAYTYDARGRVKTRTLGNGSTPFDLKYFYDYAERLERLEARNPWYGDPGEPQFRVMKRFTFADANTGANLRKGKLLSATRVNYPVDEGGQVLEVVQTYDYTDPAGRPRTRKTELIDATNEQQKQTLRTINTTVALDNMGNVAGITYPMCVNCGVPGVAPERNLAFQYTHGRLTQIPGVTAGNSAITYWPNGMKKVVPHANGIADTQTVTNMPRPSKLSVGEYDRCVSPVITDEPDPGSINEGQSYVLSVTATGTGELKYTWHDPTGPIATTTTPTHTVTPPDDTTYHVVVSSPCGFVTSQEVPVSVCRRPRTGNIAVTRRAEDGAWVLTPEPVLDGNNPAFLWQRVSDNATVGTQQVLIVPSLTVTTEYKLTITDSCGTSEPAYGTAVVLKMSANGVTATYNGSSVVISWPAAQNAASYAVERRWGYQWQALQTTTATSYTDTTAAANRTYAYRVRALAANNFSDFSNADVATTRTFSAPQVNSPMYASYSEDMLAAVNSVRATVGWAPLTWSNILPSSTPLVSPGTLVTAAHINACRTRMDEALQTLGALTPSYTDAIVSTGRIKALHVSEIQERAK